MPFRRPFVVMLAAAVLLAGCSSAPKDSYGKDGGLSLSVVQSRNDHGARIVSLEVKSNRKDSVTLNRAELTTAQLKDAAVWAKGTVLRPGLAIDLKVQLGDPSCPIADDITARVSVNFTTPEGVTRTVSRVPDQPAGILPTIADEDCLAAGLLDHTGFEVKDFEWTPGANKPATLVIALTPTDAAGSVTIRSVLPTVLMAIVTPDGGFDAELPLDLTLDAETPQQDLRVGIIPNRCDTHAIAEDKRGTFFPFRIEVEDGPSGLYFTAMTEEQKSSAYDFIRDYCHAS